VKTLRLPTAFGLWLAFAGFAPQTGGGGGGDPELERRVKAFLGEVRCLVCQNETLADSRADLAVDLRREIREQMEAGKSDEEITAFLTARYGDFVLYRPPLKPSTYALWFGPFLLLGAGFFALYRFLNRAAAHESTHRLSAAERMRAKKLLEDERKGTS
jgi:cytochrome c-type biogenesis protein CcmH